MDDLEDAGIVSEAWGARPREVLLHDETSLVNHLNSINYKIVPDYIYQTSILGISRLRMGTDGHGITALVAFYGCPLSCRYCLNSECHNTSKKVKRMLPEEVIEELRKDELYYIATKGGVTFGGGEPLLNSQYIKDILELGAKRWNVTVETSLNVPRKHLKLLLPYINEYIVDIKDMNSEIYMNYTRKNNNQVIDNLKWLIKKGMAEHIVCRIPLIPNHNTTLDQENSKKELLEMGIARFDIFNYIVDNDKTDNYDCSIVSNKTMGLVGL
jgi:pyruvate formate lyase activating enzyme